MRIDERRIPLSDALRPWISKISVTTIAVHAGARTIAEPPDHSAALALHVSSRESTPTWSSWDRVPGRSTISVSRDRSASRPGHAASLLGRSVAGLRDRAVLLSELWGTPGAQLERELTGVGSDPDGIDER
ncbi:hypothetical protein [Frankia sp. AiPa1]|uniref:hypothetical protein n=1 Tax=Frankia sp. AiPa1 TaxID=573492 RepID=UPI00202B9FA9|nr:hypothetical protein [Frankia sp. AiPa1]MCL9759823.1 hypothetical protein [Frankia sp. AiPa1]